MNTVLWVEREVISRSVAITSHLLACAYLTKRSEKGEEGVVKLVTSSKRSYITSVRAMCKDYFFTI